MAEENVPSRHGSHIQPHRPKRRRIALACSACREHKVRCDGRRPACGRCTKKCMDEACVYEESSLMTQRYLADRRRQAMVAETQDGGIACNEATDSMDLGGRDRNPPSPPPHITASAAQYNKPPRTASTWFTLIPIGGNMATDALNIVPQSGRDAGSASGGSSAISFATSIIKAVSDTAKASGLPDSDLYIDDGSERVTTPSVHFSDARVDQSVMFLPTRRAGDSFVSSFFECMHPIFPILHRPSFMVKYQQIWMADSNQEIRKEADDPVFLALVYVVFAIGCHFSELHPPAARTSLADQFYRLSRRLFVMDFLDSPTLLLVQFLLLTGVYLQSTQYASRCWQSISMGIRAAQEIGLHLEKTTKDSEDQLKREMQRRVWHTCVILDRLLALTFSRPMMIPSQSNVSPPQMIDDEHLLEHGEGTQPCGSNSRMGLFVLSIKLFDILYDVLTTMYSPYQGDISVQDFEVDWQSGQRLSDIVRLNTALDDLLERAPTILRSDRVEGGTSSAGHSQAMMQANTFYPRLLYIRALLLRPVLLSAVHARNSNAVSPGGLNAAGLQRHMSIKICILCLSTVHELVARLHEKLNTVYRTSPWHTVHYIFACSVVLVAARLCPIPGPEFSDDAIQLSWSRCNIVLEHYKAQIHSASHAMRILQALHNRVSQIRNRGDSNSVGATSSGLARQEVISVTTKKASQKLRQSSHCLRIRTSSGHNLVTGQIRP